MYSIQFLALAQDELDDIFQAYEFKKENLGHDFIKEIKRTLYLIKSYPYVGTKSSEHTQKYCIKGFPYALIFHQINDIILIISIMNLHKKPIHWATKSVSEYSTCRISILPETLYIR
jgi:plasmid stabilization system protein ParE